MHTCAISNELWTRLYACAASLHKHPLTLSAGPLRPRNAFRNREDGIPLIPYCILSASAIALPQLHPLALTPQPQFYPTKRKLIYCSRTVPEIEKALAELKRLMAYRIQCAETPEQKAKEEAFTGLGLTSRKNLCIHPEVSKEKKGVVVDARCRDLTNAVVCEKGRADPGSVELCEWHEVRGLVG